MKLIIVDTPNDSEIIYILSCSYTQLKQYQFAFDQLNTVLALNSDQIMHEIYLLHAHLCIKLHSNTVSLFPQAVLDFDYLIQHHPEDMNYVK